MVGDEGEDMDNKSIKKLEAEMDEGHGAVCRHQSGAE